MRHEEWRNRGNLQKSRLVEGPIGLRQESSRLVLGMERGLLYLSGVAQENALGDEVGEVGRADRACV